jgi:hypothetical protein
LVDSESAPAANSTEPVDGLPRLIADELGSPAGHQPASAHSAAHVDPAGAEHCEHLRIDLDEIAASLKLRDDPLLTSLPWPCSSCSRSRGFVGYVPRASEFPVRSPSRRPGAGLVRGERGQDVVRVLSNQTIEVVRRGGAQ